MGKDSVNLPVEFAVIRVIFFAIPTLTLFWLGVDFGVGDIDAQDLVVKIVLLVLSFRY